MNIIANIFEDGSSLLSDPDAPELPLYRHFSYFQTVFFTSMPYINFSEAIYNFVLHELDGEMEFPRHHAFSMTLNRPSLKMPNLTRQL